MDDLARFNKDRWEELVREDVLYSRPWLDLDAASARERLNLDGILDDVAGKRVLVLAGGGGQQSAAFALLGAQVTVVDIAEGQLERARQAAAFYRHQIETVQGDMRDLSRFEEARFDLVYHPYSINFVPDPLIVFREVVRVLRPGGHYFVGWANPFVLGLEESQWDGRGYPLRMRYADEEVRFDDLAWEILRADGTSAHVTGPREFRHTAGTFINGLIAHGFVLLRFREEGVPDYEARPGSWGHFCAVAPPYLGVWAVLRPDVFG